MNHSLNYKLLAKSKWEKEGTNKMKSLIKSLCVLVFLSAAVNVCADDDGKKQELEKLMELTKMEALVDQMYSQMEVYLQDMSKEMGVQPSEQIVFDEYHSKMIALLHERLGWKQIGPAFNDIYMRNFSEKEIHDMVLFYETETGKSTVEKMPLVMQESMQITQTAVAELLPEIKKIAEELRMDLTKMRETQK